MLDDAKAASIGQYTHQDFYCFCDGFKVFLSQKSEGIEAKWYPYLVVASMWFVSTSYPWTFKNIFGSLKLVGTGMNAIEKEAGAQTWTAPLCSYMYVSSDSLRHSTCTNVTWKVPRWNSHQRPISTQIAPIQSIQTSRLLLLKVTRQRKVYR